MPRITLVPKAYLTPDGDDVKLTMVDDEGIRREYVFSRKILDPLMKRLEALLDKAPAETPRRRR
ncbi:MAG: hypothetical protein FJ311_00065 [Rhodospirillales bacterium]|nr:hypothetical protein [Rhodospirillales bacterium]